MDPNRLSKMNELSKELQKHGFAGSSLEASEQAQGIMKESLSLSESSKQSPKGSEVTEGIVQMMKSINALKTYKSLSEEKIIKLESNFQLVLSKVNEIISEINSIKEQQKDKNMPVQKETQSKLPKKEKSESHPRQGNYSPGDVAIDKIFYYGQK